MNKITTPTPGMPQDITDFVWQLAVQPNARLTADGEDQSIDKILEVYGARKQAVLAARKLLDILPKGDHPEFALVRAVAALTIVRDRRQDWSEDQVEEIEEGLADETLLDANTELRDLEAQAYELCRARFLANLHANPCKELEIESDEIGDDDLATIYSEMRDAVVLARHLHAAAGAEFAADEAGVAIAAIADTWIAEDEFDPKDYDDPDDYEAAVDEYVSDLDDDALLEVKSDFIGIEEIVRSHFAPAPAPAI